MESGKGNNGKDITDMDVIQGKRYTAGTKEDYYDSIRDVLI